jgi:4-amino-4-deoxy-L-arabinose transferase-like glycosyltransferase
MQIIKKDINSTTVFFILLHVIIWTLVPTISNNNLPLDTIEALAWGRELEFGYSKHPPLSAWVVEFFYGIFGNNDWTYYLLSQIFVGISFFIIFKFSEDFFKNKINSLLCILLLEGIFFYNFTTPEFNVNISHLLFWSLTVFYCWRGIKFNNSIDWLLFGLFAALGVLCKYSFIYLLLSIDIFFIYTIIKYKKFDPKCLISLVSFFIVLLPHLIWLVENDYITIKYIFARTDLESSTFKDHIFYPLIFLSKQIGILMPFFIMIFFIVKKFKINMDFNDNKLLFLISLNILPIFLVFLTSLLTGANIRTMWMTPFYLFLGIFFLYIFETKNSFNKLNKFFYIFIFLFILSPFLYFIVSIVKTEKRTDYPGKYISEIVQTEWTKSFSNKIDTVIGDEWYAGNLSYHLESRPKIIILKKDQSGYIFLKSIKNKGLVLIEPFKEMKECSGVFYQIPKLNDICMVGKNE